MFTRVERTCRRLLAEEMALGDNNGLILRQRKLGEFEDFLAVPFARFILKITLATSICKKSGDMG